MVGDLTVGESRMDRKKAETRQKIIEAALDLFNRQGFHGTTMEQIAEGADVARKTLYNYYPVKEAIVDEYMRNISMGLAAECRNEFAKMPNTATRLKHALLKVYHWVSLNHELAYVTICYRMQVMKIDGDSQHKATGTEIVITEILRQGQENGEIRHDLPAELMMLYLNMLRSSIFLNWLKQPGEFSLEEKIGEVVDLFLNGVITDAVRARGGVSADDIPCASKEERK